MSSVELRPTPLNQGQLRPGAGPAQLWHSPSALLYKPAMGFTNDVIAVCALALLFPAGLFIAALVLRQTRSLGGAPRTAERIVLWYGAHPQLALWGLLLLCPFWALVLGGAALLRTWDENAELRSFTWRALAEIPEHWPAMSIGVATLLAFAVLVTMTAHLMRETNH